MAGPRIRSKEQLKQYILRRLGAPVVNIELTDDQLNDAIADTLDDYMPTAYSGMSERYYPVRLLKGVTQYKLPYETFAVLDVFDAGTISGIGGEPRTNPFQIRNYVASDLFASGLGKVDLLTYELTFEFLETMNLLLAKKISFDFNTYSRKLTIFATPQSDMEVILQCYVKSYPEEKLVKNTDPDGPEFVTEDENNIYDIKWIRLMSVEKSRYQWATNMMKYSGSVLPNGGNLNVDGILNEAKENIEKLKDSLDSYSLPPDFFCG